MPETYAVVSECLGHGMGGDGRLSALLASELARSGAVTVFTLFTDPPAKEALEAKGITVIVETVQRGTRWQWPHRSLARRVQKWSVAQPGSRIFKLGITPLTEHVLRGAAAAQNMIVLETTNATPGNPFVDAKAIRLLDRCRAVSTPAQAIEDEVRTNHAYTGPILRLPHWIDADELALASQAPGEASRILLYLGRMDADKGLFDLLEAFAGMAGRVSDAKLRLCGPGSTQAFEERAAALEIRDRVTFTCAHTRAEIGQQLAEARCLVLPSHHEGYPLTPLEALAAGCPVILSDVGGNPEIARIASSIRLVGARDVPGLSSALEAAWSVEGDAYETLCRQAREQFELLSGKETVQRNLQRFLESIP